MQTSAKFNLYPNGDPSSADINQKGVNDCALDSMLAQMANDDPQYIKNAISDNKDGTYTVHMFDPSGKPIDVTVDSALPVDKDGKLLSNASSNGSGTWGSIMEKALVKYNQTFHTINPQSGYEGINKGVLPKDAYAAFTGVASTDMSGDPKTTPDEQSAFMQNMQDAVKNGQMLQVWTNSDTTLPSGAQIVGTHAYSVMDVNKDSSGQWYVDVRNPWGYTAGANDQTLKGSSQQTDDGVIRLSMSQFLQDFPNVSKTQDPLPYATKADSYTAPAGSNGIAMGSASSMTVQNGQYSSKGIKHDQNTASMTADGYTISYTQKNNAANALTITDSSGKDVTPANMKDGTNGSVTLPNGSTVTVSGSGSHAVFAVSYLGYTQQCAFAGAGKKGGYQLTNSTS
jgi:hypothetical protein